MIYVLFADGFEEVEAICPVDVLRRGGCRVKTVGVTGREVRGAHGIVIGCDVTGAEALDTLRSDPPEMIVLPGGMPGTRNIDSWQWTDAFIEAAEKAGGYLAAICAAPSVLGKRGRLKGKKAVCYPGFEDYLSGADVVFDDVVRDGKVITARGAGCAMKFALELLSAMKGEEAGAKVAESVIFR